VALTQFADQQHGQHFAVTELALPGAAMPARRVATVEALPHPVVDDAEDDGEQVGAAENASVVR
jgi:hypothetical protein